MTANEITHGASVWTADGSELGKVKEIVGGCFKVDAPLQPDYWLATDTISSNTEEGIILRFGREELDAAMEEGREHSGYHRHT